MKKIIIVCVLFTFMFPASAYSQDIPVCNSKCSESISTRSDLLEWKYKFENGQWYKRLWDKTRECFVGDWIPV